MTMTFPPLRFAIAQAESWTRYLDARHDDANGRQPKEMAAALTNIIGVGIRLGEMLPFTWRLTFLDLFRPGEPCWTTVKEFESARQEVRRLFFITREALERTRQVVTTLQHGSGRKPAGMSRLIKAIDSAAALEEAVFRDWPSFVDPIPPSTGSLPIDESLAEILGITVEEARQKMDTRRRELNTKPE